MKIALLVMTDGRNTVFPTIQSALSHLYCSEPGSLCEFWINDDTGSVAHADLLNAEFPDFNVISSPGRSGFGGAIRNAWDVLRDNSEADFIFHLEDDFLFNRRIDLTKMCNVLDHHGYLVNLALRRQPWNPEEQAAGGIVELWPHEYVDCTDGEEHWLEHRLFFTTNPGVYRRSLMFAGWPSEPSNTERLFSEKLLQDPYIRFGYYGSRDSGEAVSHIGHTRNGTGY